MIAYVDGLLDYIDEDVCVIDVGGVGMNVYISERTMFELPSLGSHVRLYTYTSVREDAILLFGFSTRDELSLFKKLISVNSVGPKGALSILSTLDADHLRYAIESEDAKSISKAPGIGAKTAQKIILDLKGKIKSSEDSLLHIAANELSPSVDAAGSKEATQDMLDAIAALVSLGHTQTDSHRAVFSIPDAATMDSGALLSAALKYLF